MSQPDFTMDIDHNEYLAEGARDINAILTVTMAGTVPESPAGGTDTAEIIIIDCSGSMGSPGSKIAEARAACSAAVDVIRDGVAFAVIAGTHKAEAFFPEDGSLAVAGPQTRESAKQAVRRLRPSGGTAIGAWLRLAHQMFTSHPARLRHAILLTDGNDESESSDDLDAAIKLCEGVFSCDCRGVGTDWRVGELRRVSTALLGSVDIVPDPAGLAADFSTMMAESMGKRVADVSLRIWTPQHASMFLKQVAPEVEDLTGRRTESGPQAGDYPTGAWGPGESRDYHLAVQVPHPGAVGQQVLAARVSLVAASPYGPEMLGEEKVLAIWTDDEGLSTRINQRVAHFTGQEELAQAIQEGLEARRQGDKDTAEAKLGRAVALAHQSGNEETAKLLVKVVDVVDAATGTVQLKKKVEDADEMALDTRSTKTVRTRK
jgi:von Willebrand factor type A C-terminal domain/von Willebrand factor type A domain